MGHPHYDLTGQPGKLIQGSPPDWKAPRLSKAVLEAPAGTSDAFRTDLEKACKATPPKRDKVSLATLAKDFNGELTTLFQHVKQRLDMGLREAWISEEGYGLSTGANAQDSAELASFWEEPEEQWARAFVEMSLFAMYHSPGEVYKNPGTNGAIFDLFPGVNSIAMACQNLSTYCLLSRGFSRQDVGPGGLSCSAGSAKCDACDKSKALIKDPIADPRQHTEDKLRANKALKFDELPKDEQDELIEKELPKAQLYTPTWATSSGLIKAGATPGSVVIFNGGGSKTTTQNVTVGVTHSASVLRVSGSRIQFMDTGVVTAAGEGGGEAGTIDHEFTNGGVTQGDSMVAFGVAKPVADDKLKEWAKKTADAKPLGLTRLVIVATADKKVLFVSKLLHMRWQVARLIWSLRDLPATDLTLAWLVWAPRDDAPKVAAALTGKMDAPSTLIKGKLALTHVIVAPPDEEAKAKPNAKSKAKLRVYRSHQLSDWRDELGGKQTDFGEAQKWKLGPGAGEALLKTSLVSWCEAPGNYDQCFVRKLSADDGGKVSNAKMGHELVDPPDPPNP